MTKRSTPEKQARLDAKREARLATSTRDALLPAKVGKPGELGTTADKIAHREAKLAAFELPDMKREVTELLRRPTGLPLDAYEYTLTSQHGEDGLTIEILRRVGREHRRAVELGCGENGGNAGPLVAGLGWETLLVDGDDVRLARAREIYEGHPARIVHGWIDAGSVSELLATHGFDDRIDYLGIDLDGVDFWILEALSVQPRLIIMEFNALFGPDAAVTIPDAPDFSRKRRKDGRHVYPKGYFGASITALERLARRKGYRLIGSAPRSSNAYFVRDDLDGGLPTVSASAAWRPLVKHADIPVKPELAKALAQQGPQPYFERLGFPLVEVP